MFKATKLIAEALDKADLKYRTDENEKMSLVRVSMNNKTSSEEIYYFVSENDNNDVVIRSNPIVSVPPEKMDDMLDIINDCNTRFRYARFFIDKDGDVTIQVDVPTESTDADVGPVAVELLVRLTKIYDDVYPQLMKCVWG